MFDVIVIGGGVVGGLTLRELAKYRLSCCMLEKESDVCMGASKANSGIVHAGFDAAPGSLKAKFNVEGNRMMPSLCAELGVKYRNNGSLVVAFSEEETGTLKELKQRGEKKRRTGAENHRAGRTQGAGRERFRRSACGAVRAHGRHRLPVRTHDSGNRQRHG